MISWVLGLLLLATPSSGFLGSRHERLQTIQFASGRGQKARKEAKLAEKVATLSTLPLSELPRPTSLQQLRGGRLLTIDPKPDEIESLCRRLKIEDLLNMRVSLTSSVIMGGCVKST
mmetsp:Transcript_28672/g.57697  ORF Transcript_28672/g.57697 Transcript_28672/m.57697 type:complete len:117 (+) Transcript_28672:51-401(+)